MNNETKEKKDSSLTPDNSKRMQSFSGEKKEKSNEVVKTENEKTIMIKFKENRKFDLHIGRHMKTFFGRETLPVPAKWLLHKDWQNVKKYFIVKGA
jgi:hypothetical protein